ncbi:MAG: PVC-type heme-binding CxxCH protein [Planctomycetota bacterium]|nr:PVC-type heme-binding CxxCH protein [Planctomycetota bacterium]
MGILMACFLKLTTFLLLASSAGSEQPDPAEALKPIEGVSVETWASDPLLVDPVAFCIDERGRIYVAETARQERGVEDSRAQSYWNLDDISLQTNEDRLAMYRKWAHKFEGGMDHFTNYEDRIRLVYDEDGDGTADASQIFSDGYDDALDGTGSGLLVEGGHVWYTNIPHLWKLEDTNGDDVADVREQVFSGFGIRIALRGHDMHGLTWGPDGRLYWSIGDRGYNVVNQEGEHLFDPTSGAVFRCNPDGSDLEVFHTGLRNPQEIAFDDYGTLFTGDNNSDGGDRARLVHVAEGGRTGWRMEYQSLAGDNLRGPWNQEGLWHERHEHQPAWIIPPVTNIASGPSGFVHYPGLGLGARYRDHFFLCDFTGSPQHSRVLSFGVEPDGAGYRIKDVHPFVSGLLCTDVDFGWDGRMYVSDWVEGWECTETGRIFALHDPRYSSDPRIDEAALIIREGLEHRANGELAGLLDHADQRIRLQAQFALARRGDESIGALAGVARSSGQLARIHAIWGLGMVARTTSLPQGDPGHPMEFVLELLLDEDREIRGQASKVLGEALYTPAADALVELIFDPEPRVVYHATMAVGRLQYMEGLDAVTEMLWSNDNEDALLRHAGVMALAWMNDREALLELTGDEVPAVRLASLLALRRMQDPGVELLLNDPDPLIAAEAARAINDEPIDASMPALVDRLASFHEGAVDSYSPSEIAILRRALNAAMRSGQPEDSMSVARVVLEPGNPAPMRREALLVLGEWMSPSVRDRVNGAHRPVDVQGRDEEAWRTTLSLLLPALLEDHDQDLASLARELAVEHEIQLDDTAAMATLSEPGAPSRDRVASLRQLHRDKDRRDHVVNIALSASDTEVHLEGLQLLAAVDPERAIDIIKVDMEHESLGRQQGAILILGSLNTKRAGLLLLDLYADYMNGLVPTQLHVEIEEAAAGRSELSIDFLRSLHGEEEHSGDLYKSAFEGGDATLGRELVRYHSAAACLRCHAIGEHGGTTGPDLGAVGSRLDREAILESLISPGSVITEGYGDSSAMPDVKQHLTPRQVRDIVEYLASLRYNDA